MTFYVFYQSLLLWSASSLFICKHIRFKHLILSVFYKRNNNSKKKKKILKFSYPPSWKIIKEQMMQIKRPHPQLCSQKRFCSSMTRSPDLLISQDCIYVWANNPFNPFFFFFFFFYKACMFLNCWSVEVYRRMEKQQYFLPSLSWVKVRREASCDYCIFAFIPCRKRRKQHLWFCAKVVG